MPLSTKAKYQAYLQTDCWKERRQHALLRSGYVCGICYSAKATEVHHKNGYARVGEERPEDLIAICRKCHCKVHGLPIPAPKPANDNQMELDLFHPLPANNYSTSAMDKLDRWLKK